MAEPINREKEIFNDALELESPEARLGYVRGACGPDDALRERVETLLKAYDLAGGFIPNRDEPASESPGFCDAPPCPCAGRGTYIAADETSIPAVRETRTFPPLTPS